MNKYMQIVHREDIYQDFKDLYDYETDTNNLDRSIEQIFGNYKEKEVLIIEVGSWKGSSAISMAKYFLNKNITPTIFCIDTWNGSTYHRYYDSAFPSLKCKNGFPTLYPRFISNIIHAELQEYIIPIPHSSHDAARYLKKLNISADFCYVDACHEYDEVLDDIKSYWDLVKPGGTMLGDDHDAGWPDVVAAVCKFSTEQKLEENFELHNSEWVIRKNI